LVAGRGKVLEAGWSYDSVIRCSAWVVWGGPICGEHLL